LLAVAAAMQTLSFIGYWAYLSRGLTRRLLHYSFISAGVRITAILVGSQWGVLGVACAVAIGPAVLWPLSLWWLSRVTPIPVRGLVMGGLRILVVSAGVFALVRVVVDRMRDDLPLLALAAGAGAAVAFTALAWLVAPQVRADLRAVLATLRHVRPARDQPPVGP
jgi:PST family polysaccharide transporter